MQARKRKIDSKPEDRVEAEDGSSSVKSKKVSSSSGLLVSEVRSIRLEQNRKAARESRRRKKVMIEELQRSVIFFSRANSLAKRENEELERSLIRAKLAVSKYSHDLNDKSKVKFEKTFDQNDASKVKAKEDVLKEFSSDIDSIIDIKDNTNSKETLNVVSNHHNDLAKSPSHEKLQDKNIIKESGNQKIKLNEENGISDTSQMQVICQQGFGVEQNKVQAAVQATMMGGMNGVTMQNPIMGMGGAFIPLNAFAPQIQQMQNPTVQLVNPNALAPVGQNVSFGVIPTVSMAYMTPYTNFSPITLSSASVQSTTTKDK